MIPSRAVVGVDESGKGDFFGPLVVAAFLSPDSEREKLHALGVRDSKTVSDNKILRIARELKENYPFALVVVGPADYNHRYEEIRNLNKLLAACHAEVIDRLARSHHVDLAISDKFGKIDHISGELKKLRSDAKSIGIEKGERLIQVAAASMIARAEFLQQMELLSEQTGMELPRGAAAHVDAAGRRIVARHGPEYLRKIAKVHFKNFQRATKLSLF